MTTAHPTRITNAHIKRFLLGVLLLVVVGYGALTLHQRSDCARISGTFTFGLPNVCIPPSAPGGINPFP